MSPDQDFATMQDFIVGRLSEDERRAFENRLVEDPALARELEQSLRMREGLQRLRTQGYLQNTARRSGSFRVWVPSLVAAAGAGLALFLWLSRVTGPSPILMAARTGAPSVAAHFTFVAVRGGSAPELELPSGRPDRDSCSAEHERDVSWLPRVTRAPGRRSLCGVRCYLGWTCGGHGRVMCISMLTPPAWPWVSHLLRIQPDTDAPGGADVFPFNLRSHGTGASR